MSQPSRPRARGSEPRRRRHYRIEALQPLEQRQLLAPYLTTNDRNAAFSGTAAGGTVTIIPGTPTTTSAAGFTSVSQLANSAIAFGGDIVRIEAGPGGDFGKGIYAISRGNTTLATSTTAGSVGGNPGLIYRVDPTTGQSSLFFDLNTVISQITPGEDASSDGRGGSGLTNWYDLAFDPEGYFDGRPSLFVSSVDETDPNKNTIFRIGPDGSLLALFVRFTEGANTRTFSRTPSAILVPPPEQQAFLRGILVGDGTGAGDSAGATGTNGTPAGGFAAIFFDANSFRPGQDLFSTTLPAGAFATALDYGPQTGLTAANPSYRSQIYSTFADFGSPAAPLDPTIPAVLGFSGVQGLGGELLIAGPVILNPATVLTGGNIDANAAIGTPFRRFQDIAFDQYGYFSYGATVTAGANPSIPATIGLPTYVGSIFVADLASGLAVRDPSIIPIPFPVQGPGPVTLVNGVPDTSSGNTTGGRNVGGRILRISPAGVVSSFAEGFNTSGRQDAGSFVESSLSVTFSADGTTLYVADDDGIWQFKTTASLAGSTSGTLIGLNDLRSLGVPYEGQDSAVAIIDTGIDPRVTNFRGRVAPGRDVIAGGAANDDLATTVNGHGTLVAGVVAQFVPQATLQPVNVFTPNVPGAGSTTSQQVYEGLRFVADNPFVRDPIRPNKVDRTIAADLAFGTTETFDVEGTAYRAFPQIVLSFKSQLQRFRNLGITPVAATGQLGVPFNNDNALFDGTFGDVRGIALPAVLNEVVSVTGTYPFPFAQGPNTSPIDPVTGFLGRLPSPALLGSVVQGAFTGTLSALTDTDAVVYKDKLLNSSNRSVTTDFAAPELDIPTFARTAAAGNTGNLVFREGGTSLSSAIVTGSFALLASALDYWDTISSTGVTVDGYLTTPVGARVLNFGPRQIRNLSIYANPDGINSILQWTAVPTTDEPIAGDGVFLNQSNLFGSPRFREYSRIDVGNAVAAIEASVALEYLFSHGLFTVIDANNNRLITAQEIQTFVDQAATIGLPEAGALARFLGGNARPPGELPLTNLPANFTLVQTNTTATGLTAALEQPDQPDVLQRRFNFLDFAADGDLNGAISIDQFTVLAHTLLPPPDSFVIIDRQRASINNYLLEAHAGRNISDLQHILPSYAFVPARAVKRFRGISPARFKVGRRVDPTLTTPFFTLFEPQGRTVTARRRQRTTPAQTARTGSTGSSSAATSEASTPASPSPTTPATTSPAAVESSGNPRTDALNALRRLANLAPGATAAGQTPSTSTVNPQNGTT